MNIPTFTVVIFCCLNTLLASKDELVVRVENGLLQGTYMETQNGRQILGFMGIPYAKPPINDLRFQPPVKAENWDGVRSAKECGNVCLQNDMYNMSATFGTKMSEDCLSLNVYTPKINKDELLPVMVFIHGGAFHSGSGTNPFAGPRILLDKDIVLVAMNYRLGALGFITTGDEVVPGNMGLKDQALALKWVKENIIKFGGDPKSVTIFGVSAGAASTHLQMLSPLSKGLFHRAISQSGTAICKWCTQPLKRVVGFTKELAQMFDCPSEDSKNMIDCLRKMDAEDITSKQLEFLVFDLDPIVAFGPVIEPDHNGAFIADTPENILKNGKGSDVPWINGITSEEGIIRSSALITNPTLLKDFDAKYSDLAHKIVFFIDKSKKSDELVRRVREFYFGKDIIDESKEKELTNLYSEALFSYSGNKAVTLHKKYLRQPVYNYLFAYRGAMSLGSFFSGTDRDFGVSHGDDMMYFFPMIDAMMPGMQVPEEHHNMVDTFLTLWTNFAKYRNPTPEGSDFIWNPVETEGNEYLRINGPQHLIMEKNMFKERIDFWNSLEPLLEGSVDVKDEL